MGCAVRAALLDADLRHVLLCGKPMVDHLGVFFREEIVDLIAVADGDHGSNAATHHERRKVLEELLVVFQVPDGHANYVCRGEFTDCRS